MQIYQVNTGGKYGIVYADSEEDLAQLKTWLSDKIDADLEQDDTLSAEVVEQAETNWDASFAGMVTTIDIELTDDGIRQALTLGYLNSNSYCRPIIEQSMGVQPWS